jgi:ArsR family transcriptional regulator
MSMETLAVLPQLCCGPDVPAMRPGEAKRLASRFKALADPTRVAIVNRLAQAAETCVCDLTAAFDLSQPTISHHLKVLRDAGLVGSERRGTWVHYWVLPEALARLSGLLAPAEAAA